jgi:phage FluMu gp28-like protein
MRLLASILSLAVLLPMAALADQGKLYRWVDKEGVVHYSDHIPAEYADQRKQLVNEHGVPLADIAGKKTAEEIEAERAAAELALQKQLQQRADLALLSVYNDVDEIVMHRDRRVELFKAQARVTELYLRNQRRALDSMKRDAAGYKPYSADPDAAPIPQDLVEAIDETEATIERHEQNLLKFRAEEEQIVVRFEGDIHRFKALKGID